MLGDLKIDKPLAELLSLFRIIDCSIKRPLSHSQALSCHHHPALIEEFKDLIKTLIQRPAQVPFWNPDLVKGHLCG